MAKDEKTSSGFQAENIFGESDFLSKENDNVMKDSLEVVSAQSDTVVTQRKVDFDYIAKYQIRQVLGQGSMGTVYLGLNPDTDLLVAIKILPKSQALRPRLVERFKLEAKIAAKIKHQNAVRVLDAGYDKSKKKN